MQGKNGMLNGKRIGIFGKGGSGKSTFVVLLAKALRSYGYPVCVLDADSTNEGLFQAFGFESPPKELIEFFGGTVFRGGKVTCPVDDPTPLKNSEFHLDQLNTHDYARELDGIVFLSAGKITQHGPGAGCDGPIAKIARDLIVHNQDVEPVMLIDFKAGFEDTARGAVTSLDWAIMIIDPTNASVNMAVGMMKMVRDIKADVLPATAHLETPELIDAANRVFTEAKINDVFFVLNKIADPETESYLREKLLERGIIPLGCIHDYPTISVAWLKGKPIRANLAEGEALLVLDKLFECMYGSS